MATAYLAIGGNLGDRAGNLDRAVERLRAEPGVRVVKVSGYYETAPVGGPADSPAYLNAAVEIATDLPPDRLLKSCLAIERNLGRVRTDERNAPRTIDIDVLLHGDLIRPKPDPILPHPRMHERAFVLVPLAEIAPRAVHAGLKRSVSELLAALPKEGDAPVKLERKLSFPQTLAGKRALVSGSTSGIGLAIADELERAGARVVRHGRRPGVDGHYIPADLANPEELNKLFDEAWKLWDGLDIWIQNAGADTLTSYAAKWPFEKKLKELLTVDVEACIHLTRKAGEAMKAGGGGTILTIGWDQAEQGMEGDSGQLFAAVKNSIHGFTKSLAKSLAPNVRVNCIAPGWIRTAWGETASDAWQERVRAESLLGRWGMPEDIARVARFLCSDDAAYVNGQVIKVNGGM